MNFVKKSLLILFLFLPMGLNQDLLAYDNSEHDLDSAQEQEILNLPRRDGVLPKSASELEISLETKWTKEDGSTNLFDFPLLVEYGLAEGLEIEFEIPYELESVDEEPNFSGFSNVNIGALYNFFADLERGFALSSGMNFGFSSLSNKVGEKSLSYEPSLVIFQSTDIFEFDLSFSLNIEDPEEKDEKTEVTEALSFEAVIPFEELSPVGEISFESTEGQLEIIFSSGVIWEPDMLDSFEFELGFFAGLNRNSPDFGITFKIAWDFEFGEEEEDDE